MLHGGHVDFLLPSQLIAGPQSPTGSHLSQAMEKGTGLSSSDAVTIEVTGTHVWIR